MSSLYSVRADERLRAAQALSKRARRAAVKRVADWPVFSPGSINAWLVLVTTKPPSWKDPFVEWVERPLTLGEPHEGFFYPDPLGFWAEVRRWSVELLRHQHTTFGTPEAVAMTTLVHMGDFPPRLTRAIELCQPRTILFLDGPSWSSSDLEVEASPHYIHDPHRPNQVYEGFWGHDAEGRVIGKSPQHPAAHNLYRDIDMTHFLRSAPVPEPH